MNSKIKSKIDDIIKAHFSDVDDIDKLVDNVTASLSDNSDVRESYIIQAINSELYKNNEYQDSIYNNERLR